jgi:aspartate/methionine/tyrosine aminotransferase
VFQEFELERWQSANENDVQYELADSGVPALTLRDLSEIGMDIDNFQAIPLHYPQVNGTLRIRKTIAELYSGSSPADVLVTVGAAEAGSLVVDALTRPGDRIAFMRPNYQQLPGIAHNSGREVVTFSLDPQNNWSLRLDELERACTPGTRMIAVCNPNNPTGHVLSDNERTILLDIAKQLGAWLLADEVYIGTEHDEVETVSLLGTYEKTISISSLSKAYGLSGLRLGWIVGPPDAVNACWRRHEYATIATSALSMAIGEFALHPRNRNAIFTRNRNYISSGHRAIREWISTSRFEVSVAPTRATPIAFVRLPPTISSVTLAKRLVDEVSVLVAPGQYFGGFDDHIRITAAREVDQLDPALELIADMLVAI